MKKQYTIPLVLFLLGMVITIIGALFKILHWELGPLNGGILLAIGLITEALIFAISAFEPVDDDLDWSLVYPELAGGMGKNRDKGSDDAEGILSKKLDEMLKDAQIDAELMGSLSESIRSFEDVAKVMQMYLQKGTYGGRTYITENTFNKFNTCYFCKEGNRRGVGFDKPQLDDAMATCGCVSFKSFGHSGYTGTYTFVDPETEIVYVFMSNRVYPTRDNNKLGDADIRTKVQRLIQESIIN